MAFVTRHGLVTGPSGVWAVADLTPRALQSLKGAGRAFLQHRVPGNGKVLHFSLFPPPESILGNMKGNISLAQHLSLW